jgi:hypothetical protein
VVTESQRKLIEETYGVVGRDGRPMLCEAGPAAAGGAWPVVYKLEWQAKAAAGKFALLNESGWVPYRCPLAFDGHYHLCARGLEIICPRCGATPGMPCFDLETALSRGTPEPLAEPHPERVANTSGRAASGSGVPDGT